MCEARLQTEWDRVCVLVAKIHNVNCTKRGDQITDPSTLNPLRQKRKKSFMKVADARRMLTGRKN